MALIVTTFLFRAKCVLNAFQHRAAYHKSIITPRFVNILTSWICTTEEIDDDSSAFIQLFHWHMLVC